MNWGRKKQVPSKPVWALGVCPVTWIEDYEEIIDGVRVEFQKPGWSWSVLRDDLTPREGWLVATGEADTREEALEVGLAKLKELSSTSPS